MAVGSKAQVYHGTASHTAGGLTRADLEKRDGRIISKRKSLAAHDNPALMRWRRALMAAREKYRSQGKSLDGFLPLRKGTPEYTLVRKMYKD